MARDVPDWAHATRSVWSSSCGSRSPAARASRCGPRDQEPEPARHHADHGARAAIERHACADDGRIAAQSCHSQSSAGPPLGAGDVSPSRKPRPSNGAAPSTSRARTMPRRQAPGARGHCRRGAPRPAGGRAPPAGTQGSVHVCVSTLRASSRSSSRTRRARVHAHRASGSGARRAPHRIPQVYRRCREQA